MKESSSLDNISYDDAMRDVRDTIESLGRHTDIMDSRESRNDSWGSREFRESIDRMGSEAIERLGGNADRTGGRESGNDFSRKGTSGLGRFMKNIERETRNTAKHSNYNTNSGIGKNDRELKVKKSTKYGPIRTSEESNSFKILDPMKCSPIKLVEHTKFEPIDFRKFKPKEHKPIKLLEHEPIKFIEEPNGILKSWGRNSEREELDNPSANLEKHIEEFESKIKETEKIEKDPASSAGEEEEVYEGIVHPSNIDEDRLWKLSRGINDICDKFKDQTVINANFMLNNLSEEHRKLDAALSSFDDIYNFSIEKNELLEKMGRSPKDIERFMQPIKSRLEPYVARFYKNVYHVKENKENSNISKEEVTKPNNANEESLEQISYGINQLMKELEEMNISSEKDDLKEGAKKYWPRKNFVYKLDCLNSEKNKVLKNLGRAPENVDDILGAVKKQISDFEEKLEKYGRELNEEGKEEQSKLSETSTGIVDPKKILEQARNTVVNDIGTTSPKNALCNRGVYTLIEKLTGDTTLKGLQANAMYDYLTSDKAKETWKEVKGPEGLQKLASEGHIIIAVWKNLTGPHGHVVCIMPGEEKYSEKWECKVPKTMDTGKGHRWPTNNTPPKTLADGFGKEKRHSVKYFIFVGTQKN